MDLSKTSQKTPRTIFVRGKFIKGMIFMKKKDSGEIVGELAALIMTIITSFCLIISGIYFLKFSETKSQMSAAIRNTILQMEETGYLDDFSKNQLKTKLVDIGITGVSGGDPQIEGTQKDADDLPNIYLTVSGKIPFNLLGKQNGDAVYFHSISVPVTITQHSVAIGFETEE